MPNDTIAFASDHGALDLKDALKKHVEAKGLTVLELGTTTMDSVDYPDYADILAQALKDGRASRGILLCGSGIGISIAANRHPHVRAALVHDAYGARMSRLHNDANVLVLGGRTTGPEVAKDCVDIFLSTEFEGGRHQGRVEKMSRAPQG
ncbi:ribose 5-phosphate isomerase B [Novispirillum sp. DQ9]|uniref:ribose 5-phosphate isomerase B n=1 Tax=Novispirillum sp. DQ9 TaxID=3398612 RepID=UPI003C7DDB12